MFIFSISRKIKKYSINLLPSSLTQLLCNWHPISNSDSLASIHLLIAKNLNLITDYYESSTKYNNIINTNFNIRN